MEDAKKAMRDEQISDLVQKIALSKRCIAHMEKGALLDPDNDDYVDAMIIEKEELQELRRELERALHF